MKKDNRIIYNWIMVGVMNLEVCFLYFLENIKNNGNLFNNGGDIVIFFILLSVSLFSTIVPTLISRLKSKHKNIFGFGIAGLLLLMSLFCFLLISKGDPYNFIDFIVIGSLMGLSFVASIVFILMYFIGLGSQKWNSKLVLEISLLLPILFVFLLFYLN